MRSLNQGITRRTFVAVAAAAATSLAAQTTAVNTAFPVRREMRGMWLAIVDNWDWPSRQGLDRQTQQRELTTLLDAATKQRLNAVFFQVRPTADALWPSPYEPWSEYLTGVQGKNPGWNPLEFAVHEAHKRGLELHAWFNPYRVAKHGNRNRLIANHPAHKHPEWVLEYGGQLYYNPGIPQVRKFIQEAIMDAVRRYPVDGVHFDDYFYPYPVAGESFPDDEAYEMYGQNFTDRSDWRRANVNQLIKELKEKIASINRTVRFGVSPWAIWRNDTTDRRGSQTKTAVQSYDDLYADTQLWVRQEWVDYIMPQLYWPFGFQVADYAKLVPWWTQTVKGTTVDLYIGEALYKVGSEEPAAWQDSSELSRHLTFTNRYREVHGHVYFSAKFVKENPLGSVTRIVKDHYSN